MEEYYNPLDIFKKTEAIEYLGKSIDEAKSSSIVSAQNIQNFIESSLFTKYIAFPNPIGGLFNLGYWSMNRTLRSLTYEQLKLLEETNSNIDDNVKTSISLSAINLYMASNLKKKTNETTDYGLNTIKYAILNLSLTKGLDKMAEKIQEKEKKYMWDLCKYPLSLLLNYACYNKSCEHAKVRPMLLDLLQNAIASSDIEDFCKKHYLIFEGETLQTFIVEKFSDVELFYGSHKESLPTLQSVMNIATKYKHLIQDIK